MKQNLLLAAIIIGFMAQYGLSRLLEAQKTQLPPDIAEADLYFKPETIKKLSFGFNGLIADYYWMNSLQYIGDKVHNSQSSVQLDNLRPLNPRLLYPLLDIATTLDPNFNSPYTYGSVILPAIDIEQAIRISEKGVAAQPDDWRMYHHLGFIYWKKHDFKKAAEVYALGSTKPKAPDWMKLMSANLEARGGNRDLAREMYRQMYVDAPNESTKELALKRLMQVDSLDERDGINHALKDFQQKNARCPNAWREVYQVLRTVKLANNKGLGFSQLLEPVDPSNAPYLISNQNGNCSSQINVEISKVPTDSPIE